MQSAFVEEQYLKLLATIIGFVTEYKLKYIGLVNELLSILAKYDDYNGINAFATQALKLTPENIKAHYWLIYAMYHSGAVELAKNEVQRAKSVLTKEAYEEAHNTSIM